MSAKVSQFAPVKIGSFRYLFFIIGWNDYQSVLKEELKKQLDAFGADLGTSGMVLQPYGAHEYATFDEIARKDWPKEVLKRLGSDVDPCMLVIDTDFEAFSPSQNRWALVWFSDLKTYDKDVASLFHSLARMSRANTDLFNYLKRLSDKQRLKKGMKLGHLAKYFDVGKPQVFGISIDVNAIISDLADVITRD